MKDRRLNMDVGVDVNVVIDELKTLSMLLAAAAIHYAHIDETASVTSNKQ
jgi:hypothetical protein